MKQYLPVRPAHKTEQDLLARFLANLEYKGAYTDQYLSEIQQAVGEATITVFPNQYKQAHLVMLIWSENYPQLPNHPERFKLTNEGKVTLFKHTGRRKYHRARWDKQGGER